MTTLKGALTLTAALAFTAAVWYVFALVVKAAWMVTRGAYGP
jgi:hypothetical protein